MERYAKTVAAFDSDEQIGTDATDILMTSLRHQGDMRLALAQWPEAIDAFRRAFTLESNDVRIQTNLGWVLFRAGRYDEAEEQLLPSWPPIRNTAPATGALRLSTRNRATLPQRLSGRRAL